ncbi:thioredoxin TrxC (plasmid) [Deinococcus metallilatus]|uniref:Thioredoxin n=1 Tax=Deinococcus metallilatus TaxID=1211322 RepID=A0ABR6MYC2_9DEIO|nr:thioredoxin TrxC [Deinococcus metallilatus]MBB5296929.1 thioredoxin 2 [Deinococcus metallilatus]QBY06703.1 thioredoxin TrxC [Deinococcus metallilatus]GMA15172.1 thiol reductase thioredoxin [Deinococcus metallilatus]
MSDILTCPNCHAKNRVQNVPAGQVPVCARCGAPLPWLHDGTDASFEGDVQASVPVLVDFWAPWCGPCRVMGPVLEDIAREQAGKVRIVKVNVDENPAAPARFQVQGIPTMILFKGGQPVDRIVGAVNKNALMQRLNSLA